MSQIDVRTVDGIIVATVTTKRISTDDQIHSLSKEIKTLLTQSEPRKLLLNMGNVESMVSLMIGELIMLQKHFEANQAVLRLCAIRPTVVESLQISGICELFEIDENEETGLAEIKS